VQLQHLSTLRAEAVSPGVAPDIGAVAANSSEFDIVQVGGAADPPDQSKFVLGAVERAHPAIALGPNADVEQRIIAIVPGAQSHPQVTPIHESKMHGTWTTERCHLPKHSVQECGVFAFAHLAGRHDEVCMLPVAEPAGVTIGANVVRRIGQHQPGPLVAKEPLVTFRVTRIAAQQPVRPEQPEIAQAADGRAAVDIGDLVGIRIGRDRAGLITDE